MRRDVARSVDAMFEDAEPSDAEVQEAVSEAPLPFFVFVVLLLFLFFWGTRQRQNFAQDAFGLPKAGRRPGQTANHFKSIVFSVF